MSRMQTIELLFIIFSAISALSSGLVVFTGCMSSNMRNRPFMQMILFIAATDFVASIFSSVGFPADRTTLCALQSFFAFFFFKASWLWIVMLSHQMYWYVATGKFGLSRPQMHFLCWLIPLVTTLIPLSQTTYGTDDHQEGWCFLTDHRSDQDVVEIWISITFSAVLFGCIVVTVYYAMRLWAIYRLVDNAKVSAVVWSLFLYPCSLLVTWLPNLIFFTLANVNALPTNSESNNAATTIILILSTQTGTCTALIFFFTSREARWMWRNMLAKILFSFAFAGGRNTSVSNDSVQVFYGDDGDVGNDVFHPTRSPREGEWAGVIRGDGADGGDISSRTDSLSLRPLSKEKEARASMIPQQRNSKLDKSMAISPNGLGIPIFPSSSEENMYAKSPLHHAIPSPSLSASLRYSLHRPSSLRSASFTHPHVIPPNVQDNIDVNNINGGSSSSQLQIQIQESNSSVGSQNSNSTHEFDAIMNMSSQF